MNRPVHGALVGFGFIAESGHAPEYARRLARGEVEIVAVADGCAARRDAAKRAFPNARVYESHTALLDKEAAQIDYVDVTAPPYAHADVTHAALSRGLHVLCEKPIATSGEAARSMAEHATTARRVVFPCHNYRHAPVVEEVRSVLASGVIGPVRQVTLQTFRTTHAKGVREWRPDWRRERRLAGGGIAMDHGSHTLYLAFEWLKSYPTSVTAKFDTLEQYDTEDNFSCTLTFPTGIATAHLTWTAGVRKVIYTLHGCRGAITVDDDVVTVHRADGGGAVSSQPVQTRVLSSHWMDASHKEWFGRLFDEFLQAIREGDYVGARMTDAIHCIETIDAAYESAARDSREVAIVGSHQTREKEYRSRPAPIRAVESETTPRS
jgi:predicted dehydrogenase